MGSVLENIFDTVRPRRRVTRKHIMVAASVAAQLLSLAVIKRPALAPLSSLLSMLLAPVQNASSVSVMDTDQLLAKFRQLRGQLATASEEDQVRLRAQLDLLVSLLAEGDDGAKEG